MNKYHCLAAFAAALCLPASARAWECGPFKVNGGIKIYCNIQTGPAHMPLAPWYLYYPAEAQNLPVGPAGFYPNWAPRPAPGAATPPAPERVPAPMQQPPPIQQTGYYTSGPQTLQAPAYWYSR
jgi:hypothetical protein